jgi:hypothetical protein
MRVFITGGTGLIGSRLIPRLRQRQDEVVVLTRRAAAARAKMPDCTIVEGDATQPGPWQEAVAGCDAVVNLAGESIFARRWSDDFKRVLFDSRVKSTVNVVEALGRNPRMASGAGKVLVNASAVGYYGPRGDEEIDETTPPGDDVLARICVEWEAAAWAAESHGVRVCTVRTGVVLDREGGALAQLLTPFKLGLGGPAGSGKQWLPWIHHADEVGILLLGLDNPAATGPMNATAPNPVTNREFGKALGRALHRPAFFPTPGFVLRLTLGEVATVVLDGQRVLPRRVQELGYSFQFPTIDAALADILK